MAFRSAVMPYSVFKISPISRWESRWSSSLYLRRMSRIFKMSSFLGCFTYMAMRLFQQDFLRKAYHRTGFFATYGSVGDFLTAVVREMDRVRSRLGWWSNASTLLRSKSSVRFPLMYSLMGFRAAKVPSRGPW